MRRTKWLALMLVCTAGALCLSAQDVTPPNTGAQPYQGPRAPAPTKPQQPAPQPQPQQPAAQPQPAQPNGNGKAMMSPKAADCSQMTPDEMDFANQLNPMNKAMFCGKFSSDMRNSAMQMSGEMGPDGNMITNDQAVEKVAKDNNMMMPAAPAARQGGSCPAK